MISPLDTYLGWDEPEHRDGCKRPKWDIGMRTEKDVFRHVERYGEPQPKHACPDEYCDHGTSFDKVMVRLVCRSCGVAHVISGEMGHQTGHTETSTQVLGYGLAPRQAAGLLLWPGHPWLSAGMLAADEPHDFVLTRIGVKQVTADTVVGQITQSRGKLGGIVWTALAVPDPNGQYGYGQLLRWAHANDGRGRGGAALRSIPAAARWIGARLAEAKAGAA
ncbi:hypothetical protein JHN59_37530 [Streptomyces sp. MBT49]|uniref:hypothetical protein n=1 Tax=Streptomyces sp. MBT49 TaxID=1488380 RepID=UPI00190D6828|nr:hypothetical protein [Streptomyces sp. MBT49]MBK3630404.1 hypothetical protein [Streptomyces sp. MBT49]